MQTTHAAYMQGRHCRKPPLPPQLLMSTGGSLHGQGMLDAG